MISLAALMGFSGALALFAQNTDAPAGFDGQTNGMVDQATHTADQDKEQCGSGYGRSTRHRICGQALYAPILEAPGKTAVGRFGWKDQHASILSFSADAYLNEMGITNKLIPDEVTLLGNTVSEPN